MDDMNYGFSEEQIMIRDLARKIAQEKVLPKRQELDEKSEFPRELIKEFAQADLFRVFIPEEYDGLGGGCLEMSIATEELSRTCAGVAVSYAASALGAFPLLLFGTEEQKKKYLPRVASGEILCAYGLTEPNAGSDAAAIETTAREDGDNYVLNGTKIFCTNGGEADLYTIIAMTDKSRGARGATAFLLEKGTPGFSFGKKEDKLGIRASATRELVFENVSVPKENIVGRPGMGFMVAMKVFDTTRPGIGAQAVGIAQGALDAALEYAIQRKQFGQTIASFQVIQHTLADMAIQIEAARGLVYNAARLIDSGAKNVSIYSEMAKTFASDVAMKVTVDAVQIFGGYGYMKDYPVEKMMRDAKITQIYEGTNQIQRNVIALGLIKRSKGKK